MSPSPSAPPVLTLTIPGPPRGWRQQKVTHNYSKLAPNPERWQIDAIVRIRYAYQGPALECPVELEIEALMQRPGSFDCTHTSRPRRCACGPAELDGAARPHTSTPDLTNILKLAEDALVKAGVLVDDRYVTRQITSKRYAARDEPVGVTLTLRLL